MATQQEIDDLLNDEWGDQSSRITNSKSVIKKEAQPQLRPQQEVRPAAKVQESNSYADDDFQDYEESKRTMSMQQSQSQSVSVSVPAKNNPAKAKQKEKDKKTNKQLTAIKQQPHKQQPLQKTAQNYIKPALQLRTQSAFNKKNKTSTIPPTAPGQDKLHLPHNYARLQERQKQLLLTTLTEDNKRLKASLLEKDSEYKKLEMKYKMLGEEKAQHSSTAKEIALEKQVANLRTKLEQMANLNKIAEQRQKYKSKLSKNPGPFIPEQEASRRQAQLLDLIDKLKTRLIESDQNLATLHKKINQSSQHNDELHRKMKRVEQLEYKLEKMTQQAETDRGYIDILKEKVRELQGQLDGERGRYRKLEVQMKRVEMGQLTHADILRELKEVRKEKEMLEKSLKDMSATMIANVRKNYQNPPGNRLEDSNQLLKVDKN